MTRKDYELIAETVRESFSHFDCTKEAPVKHRLVGDLAHALKTTNPRFDASRFIAACNKQEQA
jgi:hypothetical protein